MHSILLLSWTVEQGSNNGLDYMRAERMERNGQV